MSLSREKLGTITDAHTLRFERLLPGPKMRVWDFLTKRELLRLWLAEGAVAERVGSSVKLDFDIDEVTEREKQGAIVRGTVFRCELGNALSYSWSDEKTESIVSFELEPAGDDVQLVLTHQDLPESLTPLCGAGWHTHLTILKARIDGAEPPPFLEVFQRVMPAYQEQMTALLSRTR